MKRFQPEFMQVDSNQSMVCSIVSPDPASLKVTALFRSYSDFGAMVFYSDESRQHKNAKYPYLTDYTDTILSFQASYAGFAMPFHNVALKPSMTVRNGGMDYYVTLGFLGEKLSDSRSFSWTGDSPLGHAFVTWNSESVTWKHEDDEGNTTSGTASRKADYEMNYAAGMMLPVSGSRIPYGARISISFSYHSDSRYHIAFGSLKQGEHPDSAVPVPCNAVEKVMFPLMPDFYNGDSQVHTGISSQGDYIFTGWTVTGGELGNPPQALPVHGYQFAEGYDDEYYQNPKRMIDAMYHLGYRGVISLYIGASHYYDFFGTAGSAPGYQNQKMVTDGVKGINAAFETWLTYFCKEAYSHGFTKVTLSISMEALHVPEEWQQKMYDGKPGRTGWEPPTYFFSPTNPSVRAWYLKVCRNILDIAAAGGLEPILQLGEPWWWWQEFVPGDVSKPYPGRPPCFYDSYTKQKFQKETGRKLPEFSSSDIQTDAFRAELLWLQAQLGEFSDYVKSIVKAYGGKFALLFFPPSVLDLGRVPEAIRIVNVPVEHWKYPELDFIQMEDYDWLIHENAGHEQIFSFAQSFFGYPSEQVEYFSGFAWDQYKIPSYAAGSVNRMALLAEHQYYEVSTLSGMADIIPSFGAYLNIITAVSSPYNAVCLRSEQYTFGDKLYIVNRGTAGMGITFVDSQWGIPTLIPWVDPGKIIVLIYNGWTADVMWTWGIVETAGDDGYIQGGGPEPPSDVIPLDYQWGLIEDAARWARAKGIQNAYFWAGTQIRRDSFLPGFFYYRVSSSYLEQPGRAVPIDIYTEQNGKILRAEEIHVETGWHEKGRYKKR